MIQTVDKNGNLLDCTGSDPSNFGQIELSTTAAYAHVSGETFIWKGQFVQATANIIVGATIAYGTNVVATNVSNILTQLNSAISELNSNKVGLPDYSNELSGVVIDGNNLSYTATQDCWVMGCVYAQTNSSHTNTNIYINSVKLCSNIGTLNSIGDNPRIPITFPLSTGDIFSVQNQASSVNLLKIFAVKL